MRDVLHDLPAANVEDGRQGGEAGGVVHHNAAREIHHAHLGRFKGAVDNFLENLGVAQE